MEDNKQEKLTIKREFLQEIKKVVNLDDYNSHKYHTPITLPKFKLPNSIKLRGWNEREWFDACVEKIYYQLNVETQYTLHLVGDLGFFKGFYKLQLLKAFYQQLELMVYNNTFADIIIGASVNNNITLQDQFTNFWYDEPYRLLKAIGLINGYGFTDTSANDLDLSQLASKEYIQGWALYVIERFNEYIDQNIGDVAVKVKDIILIDTNFMKLVEDSSIKYLNDNPDKFKGPQGDIGPKGDTGAGITPEIEATLEIVKDNEQEIKDIGNKQDQIRLNDRAIPVKLSSASFIVLNDTLSVKNFRNEDLETVSKFADDAINELKSSIDTLATTHEEDINALDSAIGTIRTEIQSLESDLQDKVDNSVIFVTGSSFTTIPDDIKADNVETIINKIYEKVG